MDRIGKKISDLLSAAAFAEAGEFESARELAKGSRKVLLVLTGSTDDSKSFTYAINVAQRVDAGLEIMYISGRKTGDQVIEAYRSQLKQADMEFHITRVSGCIKTRILEYTTKHSNIQFVVAESLDSLNDQCQQEDRSLRGALKSLRCPLVLVSEMDKA